MKPLKDSTMYAVADDGRVTRKFTLADAGLKPLRQATADLRIFMTTLSNAIRVEGRPLDPAERQAFTDLQREIETVGLALTAAEDRNEGERRAAMALDRNGAPIVDADVAADQRARRAAGLPVPGNDADRDRRLSSLRGGRGQTFAQLFPAAHQRATGAVQFEEPLEFLAAVGRGGHDQRLRLEASSMSSQDDPSGGFAVPVQLVGEWLDAGLESEIVRPRANVWPMTTRERVVPAFDATDRSDGDIAGLTLQWESETGAMDLQAAKTRNVRLTARKGAILAEASNELLADGLGFGAQLDAAIRRALSYGLDRAFFHGVGAGQPLGIYTSGALVSVAPEGGQSAATILYDNLLAMFARMLPSSIPNSVWVAHSSTIPQLGALTIPIGTGGSHIPVMSESNGSFRILTRPVIFTDKAKPLGQLGDIGLFDFSQYMVGLRADMGLERSGHVGFTRDMMTYRLTIRIDGKPNIEAPYQLPDSAPSVSPFVALEAR